MNKTRMSLLIALILTAVLTCGCGQDTLPVNDPGSVVSPDTEGGSVVSGIEKSPEQPYDESKDPGSTAEEPAEGSAEGSSDSPAVTPSVVVDNDLYSAQVTGFSADSSSQDSSLTMIITNKSDSVLNISGSAKYHDSTAEEGAGCGAFYLKEYAPGSQEEVTMNIYDAGYAGSMGQIDGAITVSIKDENYTDYDACLRADAFFVRTTACNEQAGDLLLDGVVVEKQSLFDDDLLTVEADKGYYNSCIGYVVDVSFTNKTDEQTEIYIDSPMINNESFTGFKFGFFAPDGSTDLSKVSAGTLILDPEETTTVPMCVTNFSFSRIADKMTIQSADDIESFSFDMHHHKDETAHAEIKTGKQ